MQGEGNDAIIEALTQAGALLKREQYPHKYPYDWRTKKPTIFRATDQVCPYCLPFALSVCHICSLPYTASQERQQLKGRGHRAERQDVACRKRIHPEALCLLPFSYSLGCSDMLPVSCCGCCLSAVALCPSSASCCVCCLSTAAFCLSCASCCVCCLSTVAFCP